MATSNIFKVVLFFMISSLMVFGQSLTDQTDNGAVAQPGPAVTGRDTVVIDGTLGSGSPSAPSVSGTQTGRLNRNGVASTCALPKVCDIFTTTPGYAFDAYTLPATGCVTVDLTVLTQSGANYTVNAYVGSFDPNNICVNYLADCGLSSGVPPSPLSMSFEVPPGQEIVLVVHTTNVGEIGGDYELTITGDVGLGVPTLGQWGLISFIALFLTCGVAMMIIQRRRAL